MTTKGIHAAASYRRAQNMTQLNRASRSPIFSRETVSVLLFSVYFFFSAMRSYIAKIGTYDYDDWGNLSGFRLLFPSMPARDAGRRNSKNDYFTLCAECARTKWEMMRSVSNFLDGQTHRTGHTCLEQFAHSHRSTRRWKEKVKHNCCLFSYFATFMTGWMHGMRWLLWWVPYFLLLSNDPTCFIEARQNYKFGHITTEI